MSSTSFHDPSDTVEAWHERRRQAARQRWPEYPAADLETRAGYLVDKGSGLLFKPIHHVVFARGVEVDPGGDIAGFYTTGADLVFFQRTSNPGTVAELDAQDAARARQKQEREQAHRAFVARQPLRAVTLAELAGNPEQVPTLQAAVSQLYGLGGRLEADGPDLRILVPQRLAEHPGVDEATRQMLPPLVRVIAAGRDVILAEIARGGKTPLVERLPDRHVGPAGGLA